MLNNIVHGDITDPRNRADIIIGMNTALTDVRGIGLPFVKDAFPTRLIQKGSVLTFQYDEHRRLHMLVCHDLGEGGWVNAERHVRFGLDYLNHLQEEESEEERIYSIVHIGTGRVGQRDGADPAAIKRAIADSHLMVDLFIYNPPQKAQVDVVVPLRPLRVWSPNFGEGLPLQMAA